MGITFSCPAGHLLRARRELAGKSARCPHCRAEVQVPSARPSGAVDFDAECAHWGLDLSGVKDLAGITAPVSENREQRGNHWYVALANREKIGPLSEIAINELVDSGRLPPSALVWRAPWLEWQPTLSVFPQLDRLMTTAPDLAARVTAASPLAGRAVVELSLKPNATDKRHPLSWGKPAAVLTPRLQSKRRARARALWTSGAMLVVAVILAAVLIGVLRRQQSGDFHGHPGSRMIHLDRTDRA